MLREIFEYNELDKMLDRIERLVEERCRLKQRVNDLDSEAYKWRKHNIDYVKCGKHNIWYATNRVKCPLCYPKGDD